MVALDQLQKREQFRHIEKVGVPPSWGERRHGGNSVSPSEQANCDSLLLAVSYSPHGLTFFMRKKSGKMVFSVFNK